MKKAFAFVFSLLTAATVLMSGAVAQEQPEPTQEGFVQVDDGARVYYQVFGEGEPMVLIHGYPFNSGLFRDNVAALSEQYQVVTLSLRGFGQSEAPGSDATIKVYATDVLNVMDELGLEQAIIGGHSMGGQTTFAIYQMAPERFTGMILIDTIAAPALPPEAGLWRGMATLVQEMGVEALVPALMKNMLSGETRMNRPELVSYVSTLIKQASLNGAVGGANALATRPDFTDLLPQIDVPTLIIVGLADTVYPYEIAQMMQGAIQGSELVIIPEASHAAIIETAEAANEAILEWASGIQAQ